MPDSENMPHCFSKIAAAVLMVFIHRSQVTRIHNLSPQICALLIWLHIQLLIWLHIWLHICLHIWLHIRLHIWLRIWLHIQLHIWLDRAGVRDAWRGGVSLRKLGISICCCAKHPSSSFSSSSSSFSSSFSSFSSSPPFSSSASSRCRQDPKKLALF